VARFSGSFAVRCTTFFSELTGTWIHFRLRANPRVCGFFSRVCQAGHLANCDFMFYVFGRLEQVSASVALGNMARRHDVVLICPHWLRVSSIRWAVPVRQRSGSI
jgi:hypothetical protein